MTVGQRPDLTQLTIWLSHLYENKIFYIDCRRRNGTTMLNSVDHDSMRGEHLITTSGLIVTSGKLGFWPLATPENQGFGKLRKFSRGKRPRHNCFWIYSIWEEAGPCLVCWGNNYCLLLWTLLYECEERRICWNWRTIVEEEFWTSHSWIHG